MGPVAGGTGLVAADRVKARNTLRQGGLHLLLQWEAIISVVSFPESALYLPFRCSFSAPYECERDLSVASPVALIGSGDTVSFARLRRTRKVPLTFATR